MFMDKAIFLNVETGAFTRRSHREWILCRVMCKLLDRAPDPVLIAN
jgi:hypothetical protein